MKYRAAAFAIAFAAILPAAAQNSTAQPESYSLGTSTQGGFPSQPRTIDFGPPVPSGEALVAYTDQRLLLSITEAIASDETLRGSDIQVTVSGGNVVIGGTALNEAQAAYAKGVAVGVAGAANVEGVVATQ